VVAGRFVGLEALAEAALDPLAIGSLLDFEALAEAAAPALTRRLVGQAVEAPWEMEGSTSEMLLARNTAISTTFVCGEMDALRYAEQVYAAGGVAFMMIHDVLLNETDNDSTVPPWPTHRLVYDGGLREDGDRVDFRVHTWGRPRTSRSRATASSPACRHVTGL
jgi:hypothetical protein